MRIWIDATHQDTSLRVFGMTLLERLLHAVRTAGTQISEVRVELAENAAPPADLPRSLVDDLPLRWLPGEGALSSRLESALDEAGGAPVVVLSADSVVDTRVIHHLCAATGTIAFRSGKGAERAAALRLEGQAADLAVGASEPFSVLRLADQLVERGLAKELAEADFDSYLGMLRRWLAPYAFRVADPPARERAEHFLFWSNYKGSTDFLTRYVYPALVWRIIRPLARHRVHPNWVTGLSWAATLASIPLFAMGAWGSGLAMAYVMSVLDSVDGKLARLTYTSSRFGEFFDHGLDILHPPAWYLAWGYALGGGDISSTPFQWSLWMLGIYAVDRVIPGLFKARTGRSIHGFTPLDERMRTFISRRNVNLAAFTVALVLDQAIDGLRAAEFTLYGIVVWQALCLLWHAERLVQYRNARPQGPPPPSELARTP